MSDSWFHVENFYCIIVYNLVQCIKADNFSLSIQPFINNMNVYNNTKIQLVILLIVNSMLFEKEVLWLRVIKRNLE